MSKPRSQQQTYQRRHFAHPHNVWYNGREGMRIAKRRWKRHHAKEGRRLDREECQAQADD